MREQLVSYVNLLFAGTTDTDDIRQEILQNTLDRYDDLVAQGKAPEAAYRLAISGIGDINEILGQAEPEEPAPQPVPETPEEEKKQKNFRAAAIALYIACPIPLFAIGDEIGLCLMLLLIAAATALIVMSGKKEPEPIQTSPVAYSSKSTQRSPETQKLVKTIGLVNLVICVAIYLVMSFLTGAWIITWILFPLFSCIHGLIVACIDLKEAT